MTMKKRVSLSRKRREKMSSKKLIRTRMRTKSRMQMRRAAKMPNNNHLSQKQMVKTMQTTLPSPMLLPPSTKGKRKR